MVSIRHYLITFNDELQQVVWSCLQTQAEVGVVFAAGLRLCVVAQCVSRGLAGLLKGGLSRYWLRLPVVELALRVDAQPTSCMGVLVALDLAGLALPLVV